MPTLDDAAIFDLMNYSSKVITTLYSNYKSLKGKLVLFYKWLVYYKFNAHIRWWHVATNDDDDRNPTSDPEEVELDL